jgi:hypothetical protein
MKGYAVAKIQPDIQTVHNRDVYLSDVNEQKKIKAAYLLVSLS